MTAAVGLAFVYAQFDVAEQSIRFDLERIGSSIYEARSRNGKWPARISDLDGTEYLRLPYRKAMLENGVFVVVWQTDLDSNPESNRDRILAYSNGGLLGRFGIVWACRGDLRVERVQTRELAALRAQR